MSLALNNVDPKHSGIRNKHVKKCKKTSETNKGIRPHNSHSLQHFHGTDTCSNRHWRLRSQHQIYISHFTLCTCTSHSTLHTLSSTPNLHPTLPHKTTFQTFKTNCCAAIARNCDSRSSDVSIAIWTAPRRSATKCHACCATFKTATFAAIAIGTVVMRFRYPWHTSQQIATKCRATRSNISNLQNDMFCSSRHGEGSIYSTVQHFTP